MLIYRSVCVSILGIITWHVHIVMGQSPGSTTATVVDLYPYYKNRFQKLSSCLFTEKPLQKKLCKEEICVPVTSCRSALDKIIAKDVVTLRSMFCGFNGSAPQVCCNQSQVIPSYQDELLFYDEVHKPEGLEAAILKPNPILTTKTTKSTTTDRNLEESEQTTLTPMKKLPGRNICGVPQSDSRIVGGVVTDLREYPWMALIEYDVKGIKAYLCAGSLITDQHILTAGHCAVLRPESRIVQIILGEWDLSTDIDCSEGVCNDPPIHVDVQSIMINPQYDKRKNAHDIAIMKFKTSITFTETVRPICLPDSDDVSAVDYVLGTKYTTIGWGETEFKQASIVKRKVDLKAVPKQKCENAGLVNNENAPYVICAGGQKGEDSCKGDSGGPLVRQIVDKNRSINWFLFGITSAGAAQCGTEGVPGLYTRIVPHMPWILNGIQY